VGQKVAVRVGEGVVAGYAGAGPVHWEGLLLPPAAREDGVPVTLPTATSSCLQPAGIWYGDDMSGGGSWSEWNKTLLDCAAAPAYARTLRRGCAGSWGPQRVPLPVACQGRSGPAGAVGRPGDSCPQGLLSALDLPVLVYWGRGGKVG